jgi:hypothetical protein
MSETFDVGRIVPSMRDLVAGLAMRRRSLSLVPLLGAADAAADASRLDGVVRAFATRASAAMGGDPATLRATALAVGDAPLLALASHRTAEAIQRARFFGADGVAIALDATDPLELARVARSMHMMPLFVADDATTPEQLASTEAPAWILRGSLERVLRLAEAAPTKSVLVVDGGDLALDEPTLRGWLGRVDAVVVASDTHRAPWFAALAEALDG